MSQHPYRPEQPHPFRWTKTSFAKIIAKAEDSLREPHDLWTLISGELY